jgi:hypothetical protein
MGRSRRRVKRIIEQTAWDIKRAVTQEVVVTAVELVVAGWSDHAAFMISPDSW